MNPTSKTKPKSKTLQLAHTSWLAPFAEYFGERKVDLAPCIRACDIEPELVFSGDGWITKKQLYALLNEIAERESIPELGFVVGERLTPDTLGAIGEEMLAAETLSGALEAFCRLVPRHVEGNRVWLEEGEAGDLWLLNATDDRQPGIGDIADHGGLMSLVNIMRLVAGPHWYPQRMRLQAEPTRAMRKVEGLVDAEVEFGAEATGLAFPARFLFRPIAGDDQASPPPGNGGELLERDEAEVTKLRRLLSAILGVGGIVPTIHLMAELTGVSSRTLHRRLRDAGLSYQSLVDDLRLKRAKQMLRTSDISVKELAGELGYSGANNFIRAFRRMTDMSPTEFRAAAGA